MPPGDDQPVERPVWSASEPPAPRRPAFKLLAGLVVLLLGFGGGVAVGAALRPQSSSSSAASTAGRTVTTSPPPAPAAAGASPGLDAAAIGALVNPGVVDINTTLASNGGAAAGTGMVISSTGQVLTNNHVIDEATSISVRSVTSGRAYSATVVGYDATDDVALLQLKGASGLATITPAKASTLLIGQPVVAIGNALGQGGTPSATAGVVAAVNQTVTATDNGQNPETLHGMIETNAQIQPGDSGGPLVNPAAQVVGMDTAATTNGGGLQQATQTAGFAIPIDTALTVAHEIAAGQAGANIHLGDRALLGVDIAQAGAAGGGAAVSRVEPGTPAASLGITAGDAIVAFNGTTITSGADLTTAIAPLHPGDQVTVTWVDRSGQRHTATAALVQGPPA